MLGSQVARQSVNSWANCSGRSTGDQRWIKETCDKDRSCVCCLQVPRLYKIRLWHLVHKRQGERGEANLTDVFPDRATCPCEVLLWKHWHQRAKCFLFSNKRSHLSRTNIVVICRTIMWFYFIFNVAIKERYYSTQSLYIYKSSIMQKSC